MDDNALPTSFHNKRARGNWSQSGVSSPGKKMPRYNPGYQQPHQFGGFMPHGPPQFPQHHQQHPPSLPLPGSVASPSPGLPGSILPPPIIAGTPAAVPVPAPLLPIPRSYQQGPPQPQFFGQQNYRRNNGGRGGGYNNYNNNNYNNNNNRNNNRNNNFHNHQNNGRNFGQSRPQQHKFRERDDSFEVDPFYHPSWLLDPWDSESSSSSSSVPSSSSSSSGVLYQDAWLDDPWARTPAVKSSDVL